MLNFISLLAFLPGCRNQPPSVPIVIGPQRGRPGDTLTFSVISVDRDNDLVSYLFDWSGQNSSEWTGWFYPGVEISKSFSFADTGTYFLRVKSRDHRQESGWSESLGVTIRWYVPTVPRKPSGPDTVLVGDSVTFYSSALHPLGEPVALQFRWGETADEWSDYVQPGVIVAKRYAFTSGGTFGVCCRAKDIKGYMSDWSAPETVFVRVIKSH